MNAQPHIRLAIAGIIHETNTYAAESFGLTPLSAFEQYHHTEIVEIFSGANHQIGGFIEGAAQQQVMLLPTFLGQATPSGTIEQEAYLAMKAQILSGIRASLPVDGVLLALHGAGVADGIEDIEGDLLAAVRDLVGQDIPIAAVYDLHANCTAQMFEHCDISLPCKLYPHTDFLKRGVEAVSLILDMIHKKIKPVTAVQYLPILPYIVTTDLGFIPSEVNALCEKLAQQHGVIDCSWFHGFPYADIASPCPSVICTTDDDPVLAQKVVDEVAAWIWSQKQRFSPEFLSPNDAIHAALSNQEALKGPIVINEYSDNPGGGTPGDGTFLLQAILDVAANAAAPSNKICFGMINDRAVVQQAIQAGVGSTIDVVLGGKLGPFQGQPIIAQAYVKSITDGRFVNRAGAMFEGVNFDLGNMCRLIIHGVDIIVASRAEQVYDEEPFLMHGIDIMTYKVVALKGANHFRARYNQIAGKIITANTIGLSSADILSFPRENLKKQLWPMHSVTFS